MILLRKKDSREGREIKRRQGRRGKEENGRETRGGEGKEVGEGRDGNCPAVIGIFESRRL